MPRIQFISRAGWSQRKNKINEIIQDVNALNNITINYSTSDTRPSIKYSTQTVLITIPDLRSQISNLQDQIDDLQSQIDTYHP